MLCAYNPSTGKGRGKWTADSSSGLVSLAESTSSIFNEGPCLKTQGGEPLRMTPTPTSSLHLHAATDCRDTSVNRSTRHSTPLLGEVPLTWAQSAQRTTGNMGNIAIAWLKGPNTSHSDQIYFKDFFLSTTGNETIY